MATILIGYDTEAAAVGEGLARLTGPGFPQYEPALEPESTAEGLEVMTEVHRDLGVPGTLFICGRTLVHSLEATEAGPPRLSARRLPSRSARSSRSPPP
ncbi:MAG: hypothetical protein ACE5EV_09530 [Gaiellales bacterium]